ncbi:unnamed protein product [Dibothriocephalus latus]|uniref:Reverse transcriptase domain-containing protein n=1 Tax=Dibothriocephalus latus TaxID=60516 RepID=A0A3P7LCK2_DIBLA|nr:unnamed protein product [Dibothriocephalus latus]
MGRTDRVSRKINSGTCFAKLDLSAAYIQIEVDTHRGLSQFTCLSFGIKTAPAIFQQAMDTMLTGTESAAAYLDDIIFIRFDQHGLFQRLETVLGRIPD